LYAHWRREGERKTLGGQSQDFESEKGGREGGREGRTKQQPREREKEPNRQRTKDVKEGGREGGREGRLVVVSAVVPWRRCGW
jgi:hypothetical protein